MTATAVDALVRRVPGWERADLELAPLDGGITNRNYRVDTAGGSYVVRIPGERTELLGIDRAGEVEAARRAAELGIGPAVYGVLPDVGTVITAFVGGRALGDGELAGPRLDDVVHAIAKLHRSGPVRATFPVFRVIERHAADASSRGVALPAGHAWLASLAERIERVFASTGRTPVPCHNDLLPANVLADGARVWVVDYEYAGMNEAMFDLGNLSVNSGLDAAADDRLLGAYLGRPATDRDRARLELMKIVSELREGMWALVQLAISDLDGVDFGAYADERLTSCRARAERYATDAVFAAAARRG